MNKLTKEEDRVLNNHGTESPFTSTLLNEKRTGTYNCKQCGNPLFKSDAKFDSGTGWPSFDQAIPGSVGRKSDSSLLMVRTEVHCAQCKGHLGHVFPDGPKDTTGERNCINGVCLTFNPNGDKND